MTDSLNDLDVANGDNVTSDQLELALLAGAMTYDDGSTQSFTADGSTTFTERGRPAQGRWYVDDTGRFCSFWPPDYRACYNVTWIVEQQRIVGLRFIELKNGTSFNGYYQ